MKSFRQEIEAWSEGEIRIALHALRAELARRPKAARRPKGISERREFLALMVGKGARTSRRVLG
jgi:hypothetical protein